MRYLIKILTFAKHEFLQVLPPTIFFLITFNIVALTTAMVLEEFKIPTSAHAVATMLALVVGKVVLVVNKLPMLRWFDGKPLTYPIVFKATVYSSFVLIIRLLEHWIPALFETGSVMLATDHLLTETVWRFFAMGQIWIFVLFIFYVAATEIISLFGMTAGELVTAFFREHPAKMGLAHDDG